MKLSMIPLLIITACYADESTVPEENISILSITAMLFITIIVGIAELVRSKSGLSEKQEYEE